MVVLYMDLNVVGSEHQLAEVHMEVTLDKAIFSQTSTNVHPI
jgi:hypothetical protein